MNSSPKIIAGIMGLGVPELLIILLVLCVFAAAIVGLGLAITFRRGKTDGAIATPPEVRKKCPDCAELVLFEARVCKHCGCRFAGEETPKASASI